jgi:hypothetical protein
MGIPGSKKRVGSSRQSTLLATGLGAAFGFQCWRLATWGFDLATPWFAPATIFLTCVLLGFTIGTTSGAAPWWKRGLLLGAVFGAASAFGAHTLGLTWVPYGIAAITASLAGALLMAFVVDAVSPRTSPSADVLPLAPERPAAAGQTLFEPCPAAPIRQRLADAKACLEQLDSERRRRGDSGFGKTIEERIVWGELIQLELHEIDEQVSRIRGSAGQRPPASSE